MKRCFRFIKTDRGNNVVRIRGLRERLAAIIAKARARKKCAWIADELQELLGEITTR